MRFVAFTVLCSTLCLARVALAAEPAAFATHTGSVPGWSIDQVESTRTESDREHRGFYLRTSAGSGLVNIDLNPQPGYPDSEANAAGLSLDLLAGASPWRGVALGGALLFDLAPSMSLSLTSSEEADGSLGLGLIGPFADVFPSEASGWHFGGTLGFAGMALENVNAHHHRMLGFGGALWVGDEFSIADQWSMGGGLRFMHTQTRGEAAEVDLNAFSFSASLMLSLVRH